MPRSKILGEHVEEAQDGSVRSDGSNIEERDKNDEGDAEKPDFAITNVVSIGDMMRSSKTSDVTETIKVRNDEKKEHVNEKKLRKSMPAETQEAVVALSRNSCVSVKLVPSGTSVKEVQQNKTSEKSANIVELIPKSKKSPHSLLGEMSKVDRVTENPSGKMTKPVEKVNVNEMQLMGKTSPIIVATNSDNTSLNSPESTNLASNFVETVSHSMQNVPVSSTSSPNTAQLKSNSTNAARSIVESGETQKSKKPLIRVAQLPRDPSPLMKLLTSPTDKSSKFFNQQTALITSDSMTRMDELVTSSTSEIAQSVATSGSNNSEPVLVSSTPHYVQDSSGEVIRLFAATSPNASIIVTDDSSKRTTNDHPTYTENRVRNVYANATKYWNDSPEKLGQTMASQSSQEPQLMAHNATQTIVNLPGNQSSNEPQLMGHNSIQSIVNLPMNIGNFSTNPFANSAQFSTASSTKGAQSIGDNSSSATPLLTNLSTTIGHFVSNPFANNAQFVSSPSPRVGPFMPIMNANVPGTPIRIAQFVTNANTIIGTTALPNTTSLVMVMPIENLPNQVFQKPTICTLERIPTPDAQVKSQQVIVGQTPNKPMHNYAPTIDNTAPCHMSQGITLFANTTQNKTTSPTSNTSQSTPLTSNTPQNKILLANTSSGEIPSNINTQQIFPMFANVQQSKSIIDNTAQATSILANMLQSGILLCNNDGIIPVLGNAPQSTSLMGNSEILLGNMQQSMAASSNTPQSKTMLFNTPQNTILLANTPQSKTALGKTSQSETLPSDKRPSKILAGDTAQNKTLLGNMQPSKISLDDMPQSGTLIRDVLQTEESLLRGKIPLSKTPQSKTLRSNTSRKETLAGNSRRGKITLSNTPQSTPLLADTSLDKTAPVDASHDKTPQGNAKQSPTLLRNALQSKVLSSNTQLSETAMGDTSQSNSLSTDGPQSVTLVANNHRRKSSPIKSAQKNTSQSKILQSNKSQIDTLRSKKSQIDTPQIESSQIDTPAVNSTKRKIEDISVPIPAGILQQHEEARRNNEMRKKIFQKLDNSRAETVTRNAKIRHVQWSDDKTSQEEEKYFAESQKTLVSRETNVDPFGIAKRALSLAKKAAVKGPQARVKLVDVRKMIKISLDDKRKKEQSSMGETSMTSDDEQRTKDTPVETTIDGRARTLNARKMNDSKIIVNSNVGATKLTALERIQARLTKTLTRMSKKRKSTWHATCIVCGEKYDDKYAFHRHIKVSHADEKIVFCELCSRSFRTDSELGKHRLSYHRITIVKNTDGKVTHAEPTVKTEESDLPKTYIKIENEIGAEFSKSEETMENNNVRRRANSERSTIAKSFEPEAGNSRSCDNSHVPTMQMTRTKKRIVETEDNSEPREITTLPQSNMNLLVVKKRKFLTKNRGKKTAFNYVDREVARYGATASRAKFKSAEIKKLIVRMTRLEDAEFEKYMKKYCNNPIVDFGPKTLYDDQENLRENNAIASKSTENIRKSQRIDKRKITTRQFSTKNTYDERKVERSKSPMIEETLSLSSDSTNSNSSLNNLEFVRCEIPKKFSGKREKPMKSIYSESDVTDDDDDDYSINEGGLENTRDIERIIFEEMKKNPFDSSVSSIEMNATSSVAEIVNERQVIKKLVSKSSATTQARMENKRENRYSQLGKKIIDVPATDTSGSFGKKITSNSGDESMSLKSSKHDDKREHAILKDSLPRLAVVLQATSSKLCEKMSLTKSDKSAELIRESQSSKVTINDKKSSDKDGKSAESLIQTSDNSELSNNEKKSLTRNSKRLRLSTSDEKSQRRCENSAQSLTCESKNVESSSSDEKLQSQDETFAESSNIDAKSSKISAGKEKSLAEGKNSAETLNLELESKELSASEAKLQSQGKISAESSTRESKSSELSIGEEKTLIEGKESAESLTQELKSKELSTNEEKSQNQSKNSAESSIRKSKRLELSSGKEKLQIEGKNSAVSLTEEAKSKELSAGEVKSQNQSEMSTQVLTRKSKRLELSSSKEKSRIKVENSAESSTQQSKSVEISSDEKKSSSKSEKLSESSTVESKSSKLSSDEKKSSRKAEKSIESSASESTSTEQSNIDEKSLTKNAESTDSLKLETENSKSSSNECKTTSKSLESKNSASTSENSSTKNEKLKRTLLLKSESSITAGSDQKSSKKHAEIETPSPKDTDSLTNDEESSEKSKTVEKLDSQSEQAKSMEKTSSQESESPKPGRIEEKPSTGESTDGLLAAESTKQSNSDEREFHGNDSSKKSSSPQIENSHPSMDNDESSIESIMSNECQKSPSKFLDSSNAVNSPLKHNSNSLESRREKLRKLQFLLSKLTKLSRTKKSLRNNVAIRKTLRYALRRRFPEKEKTTKNAKSGTSSDENEEKLDEENGEKLVEKNKEKLCEKNEEKRLKDKDSAKIICDDEKIINDEKTAEANVDTAKKGHIEDKTKVHIPVKEKMITRASNRAKSNYLGLKETPVKNDTGGRLRSTRIKNDTSTTKVKDNDENEIEEDDSKFTNNEAKTQSNEANDFSVKPMKTIVPSANSSGIKHFLIVQRLNDNTSHTKINVASEKCSNCNELSCLMKKLTDQHAETKNKDYAIKCPLCDRYFVSLFHVELHVSSNHIRCRNAIPCVRFEMPKNRESTDKKFNDRDKMIEDQSTENIGESTMVKSTKQIGENIIVQSSLKKKETFAKSNEGIIDNFSSPVEKISTLTNQLSTLDCPHCDEKFYRSTEYIRHIRDDHYRKRRVNSDDNKDNKDDKDKKDVDVDKKTIQTRSRALTSESSSLKDKTIDNPIVVSNDKPDDNSVSAISNPNDQMNADREYVLKQLMSDDSTSEVDNTENSRKSVKSNMPRIVAIEKINKIVGSHNRVRRTKDSPGTIHTCNVCQIIFSRAQDLLSHSLRHVVNNIEDTNRRMNEESETKKPIYREELFGDLEPEIVETEIGKMNDEMRKTSESGNDDVSRGKIVIGTKRQAAAMTITKSEKISRIDERTLKFDKQRNILSKRNAQGNKKFVAKVKSDSLQELLENDKVLENNETTIGDAKKSTICKKCNRHFPNSSSLNEHLFFLHDDSLKDTVLTDILTPIGNTKSDDENQTKIWRCLPCEQNFKLSQAWRRHRYYVHNDDSHVHVCENCSKVLTSLTEVNVHICHDVASYNCRTCNETFTSGMSLRLHNTEMHIERNTRNHCDTCDKSFLTSAMLDRHTKCDHRFVRPYRARKSSPVRMAVVVVDDDDDNNVSCAENDRLTEENVADDKLPEMTNDSAKKSRRGHWRACRAKKIINDETNVENTLIAGKRKRGRPPKNSRQNEDTTSNETELLQADIEDAQREITIYFDDSEIHQCGYCQLLCLTEAALSDHVTKIHTLDDETCQLCQKTYPNGKLIRHMIERHISSEDNASETNGPESGWKIDDNCNELDTEIFVRMLGINRLMSLCEYRRYSEKKEASYDCHECDKIFPSDELYRYHYLLNHDAFCVICNIEFKRGHDAARHKIEVHGSVGRYIWFADRTIASIASTKNFNRVADESFIAMLTRDEIQINDDDDNDDNEEIHDPCDETSVKMMETSSSENIATKTTNNEEKMLAIVPAAFNASGKMLDDDGNSSEKLDTVVDSQRQKIVESKREDCISEMMMQDTSLVDGVTLFEEIVAMTNDEIERIVDVTTSLNDDIGTTNIEANAIVENVTLDNEFSLKSGATVVTSAEETLASEDDPKLVEVKSSLEEFIKVTERRVEIEDSLENASGHVNVVENENSTLENVTRTIALPETMESVQNQGEMMIIEDSENFVTSAEKSSFTSLEERSTNDEEREVQRDETLSNERVSSVNDDETNHEAEDSARSENPSTMMNQSNENDEHNVIIVVTDDDIERFNIATRYPNIWGLASKISATVDNLTPLEIKNILSGYFERPEDFENHIESV